MATQKQIEANRLNATRSTGPRSVEGKTASSQNALKSGIDSNSQIIRGEDPAALDALAADYFRDFQPQSAAERALLDILIDTEWLLRRLRRAEAHLWECEFAKHEDRHQRWEGGPMPQNQLLGKAYDDSQTTFARLERRRDLLQRTYRRTLEDLQTLQASQPAHLVAIPSPRPQPEPPPQPASPIPAPSETPEEIGFVSKPSSAAPPTGPRTFDPAHPVPSPYYSLTREMLKLARKINEPETHPVRTPPDSTDEGA